jgi:hypothetical protein
MLAMTVPVTLALRVDRLLRVRSLSSVGCFEPCFTRNSTER